PFGQFQRSTALVSLAPAPRHRAVTAIELLNYEHAMAEPRVPGVMNVGRRGTVGLVLIGCTTKSACIARSATSRPRTNWTVTIGRSAPSAPGSWRPRVSGGEPLAKRVGRRVDRRRAVVRVVRRPYAGG